MSMKVDTKMDFVSTTTYMKYGALHVLHGHATGSRSARYSGQSQLLRTPTRNGSQTNVPAIIDKILRIGEGKILRQLETIAKAINAIEDDFVAMSDDELRGMTDEFKKRLADGETLDDIMPEAFATVREAAK